MSAQIFTGGGPASASALILAPIASPAYQRGKLVYDTDPESEAPTFFNVETQTEVHLGRELQLPVRNSGAATITAGQAVYINGNHPGTQLPTVALARADNSITATCIGIAAHDIEVNTIGYVYAVGLAHHNINTNAWNNGDRLYLDAVTPGALTNVAPTSPNFRVLVGVVTRKSANGAIYVRIGAPI